MTEGLAHAVASVTMGMFQTTTGNGNQKSFAAKRLEHGAEVAGITGYLVLISYTGLVAHMGRKSKAIASLGTKQRHTQRTDGLVCAALQFC